MAKPRVFVSSTYYDLRHIRDRLEAFIESLGYEAVLFESGDIVFHHDQPLDESCFDEIKSCHLLVLIIGNRYGSEISADKIEKTDGAEDLVDDMYEKYNSITKKEYETARSRDIPIFIFVDSGVLSEYQTYKRNRSNNGIRYAHVDSVNIFKLLDDILTQARNNFVKGFERFDDIGSWLTEQWAGLFADMLSNKRGDTSIKDISEQVEGLREVTGVLREYSEAIIRRVEPDQSESIISTQQEKILDSQARRFCKEGLINYMIERSIIIPDPQQVYANFIRLGEFEEFLENCILDKEAAETFLRHDGAIASVHYHDLRVKYLGETRESRHPSAVRRRREERMSIERLDLPHRIRDVLRGHGINTIARLAKLGDKELLSLKGVGPVALREIRKAINKRRPDRN